MPKLRQQKQQPRQSFFAGVEELVDQILFNPAIPGQQIGHEQFGKFWLLVERRQHGCLRYRGDQALFHRGRRRDAQRMAVHAAFAKELACSQNADYRFLALFRYDNNLDPALLNIEDRVCRISLGENDLILAKFNNGFPLAHLGEKFLGIKSLIGVVWHVRHGPRGGRPILAIFRQGASKKCAPSSEAR